MTTITIERALLEEVLAVLTKSSCAIGYESETEWLNVNAKIRATLAAPTAPEQRQKPYKCEDCGLVGEQKETCWCNERTKS